MWTSVSFLRGRALARSYASRTTRSTPYAVLTLTSVAISCGVPVRRRAAVAGVRALGALADDDEVDVGAAGQRGRGVREELRRTQVDVVVEGEAELQQQPALQHAGRHGRVADRAEQDGVVALEGFELRVGKGLTGAVPALGAEVVLLGLQLHVLREDGGEDLEALGHDLLADAVTGDHCEIDAARHVGTLRLRPTP